MTLSSTMSAVPGPIPFPHLSLILHFHMPEFQVRSFFALCWRQSPVLHDELGLLRDVHGPLRARILSHVGAQIRPQLPILQACVQSVAKHGRRAL